MPIVDAKARGQFKSTKESLMRKCNNIFKKYGESVALFISEGPDTIWTYQSRPGFPPDNPRGYLYTPANYVATPRQISAIPTTASEPSRMEMKRIAQAGARILKDSENSLFVPERSPPPTNDGLFDLFGSPLNKPSSFGTSPISATSQSSPTSRMSDERLSRRKRAKATSPSSRRNPKELSIRSPQFAKKKNRKTDGNKYKFGRSSAD
ncbi:uncharacterized protein PAC_14791 [Phialocephala subalpina]|uniref:MADS-box domain-containing protein n=1 Tax=Phialocephala subalpina TaxID=576137 RepID=A0A1L7XIN6_9HELO|nr:uncharacterized protein PAC_14791 [Phialocephala subalpina]